MNSATLFQRAAATANIQEVFHDNLEDPEQSTEILRIFTPFGKVPVQYVDSLLSPDTQYRSIREIQLCIESTLRPCLLDINEEVGLNQKFAFLIRKSLVARRVLKFFFLRPNVQVGTCRQPFRNFVEKDLAKAMEGLREHDVDLSDILGEESFLARAAATRNVPHAPVAYGPCPMDLVDEML